ncbi:MAG: PilZ domain-containing protein [Spirochaetota bacterium]
MDQIVFYASTLDPEVVRSAIPETAITPVYSRVALVESLVGRPGLVGAAVEIDAIDEEWARFLESTRESFPLLPLIVFVPGGGCLDGIRCEERPDEAAEIGRRIVGFIEEPRQSDRRRYHRFDWPLTARIDGSETVHRVREISAGGAFLEPHAPVPRTGAPCTITIGFQNFSLTTACELLDPRHVTSTARNGFGIRFTSLSERGRAFVDRVVADALMQVLLDPEADPGVPSIDDEEDVLTVGDEFSLSL